MSDNLKISPKNIEPLIFTASVKNLSFFMKIKNYLYTSSSKSYFNDEKYQEVFNIYCRYFDKFGKQPNKSTILTLIEKISDGRKYDEEIKLYLISIVEEAYSYKAEELDFEFIEEETINFIKQNRVYEAMMESNKAVKEGNYSAIVSKMEDAVRVSFDKDLGVSIKNIEESFTRLNKTANEKAISTGFPNLDSYLDGGLHGKELYIFAGIPGSGKTMLMGNIAINVFLQNKKVLYYTFETSDSRLLMRIFSNLTGYTKKEILLDEEGAKSKLIENIKDVTDGDFIIKEYNSNQVCSNDLMAHINDLKMYNNWVPDAIIVDYLLIMLANDKSMASSNTYKYYKAVAEDLRNIGKTLDVPVLSPAQINREGMGEKGGSKMMVTAKDISESRGIYDTADFFGTLSQTSRDKEKNIFYLYGDKDRNEESGWKIMYELDYTRMKIREGAIMK